MKSLNSRGLRTVDIARRAGYSVQQIRNLEREGVLPPALRTSSGYRLYDGSHVHSARAYRSLAAGTGPIEAKKIMRAAHTNQLSELLALLDAAHARLDRERRDLEAAKAAARAIAAEPIDDMRQSDEMSISELAGALDVRPTTLRHWDLVGLVVPGRDRVRGARRYTPDQVRDARIVHQLRLAGYRITQLQALMPELRRPHRSDDVIARLAARDISVRTRSKELLEAAAALSALLSPPTAE
ncbi:MerR family transcriptional regulator [Nocardia sp. NPDC050710]|uniref:MerR family transcriptional regulator n=1 Tax=Nocardia sp. NPDC050710 TaxID=3157220 RepID=UPI0033D06357